MCMIFVFGALIEFAIINQLVRKAIKYNQLISQMPYRSSSQPMIDLPEVNLVVLLL